MMATVRAIATPSWAAFTQLPLAHPPATQRLQRTVLRALALNACLRCAVCALQLRFRA